MKRLIRSLALAASAALACYGIAGPVEDPFGDHAPDDDPGYVNQIGILVEYIQLDAPLASKLILKHATAADATKFRDELQQLVDGKKANAQVLESGYLVTTPGQRARIASIHEFLYPTEYDLPEPPQTFQGASFTMSSGGYSAFDVRNIGHTMEVEPNLSADGRVVSLNIAPEIVEFVKFIKYGTGAGAAQQPLFHVLKLQTNLLIPANGYLLASVQMPRDKSAREKAVVSDESQRVLVFVRATVLKIPTGTGTGAADTKNADEK